MVKKVVYAIYAHKSNVDELFQNIKERRHIVFLDMVLKIANNNGITYDVVKYEPLKDGRCKVSLIVSHDWDTAWEPLVDRYYLFYEGEDINTPRVRENGRQIYHNKWQFVASDYTGFDVEASKNRTKKLEKELPNYRGLKCRIGNKLYWDDLLRDSLDLQL